MHQEAIAAAMSLIELDPVRGYAHLILAYVAAGQREKALAIVPKLGGTAAASMRWAWPIWRSGTRIRLYRSWRTPTKPTNPLCPGFGRAAMGGIPCTKTPASRTSCAG